MKRDKKSIVSVLVAAARLLPSQTFLLSSSQSPLKLGRKMKYFASALFLVAVFPVLSLQDDAEFQGVTQMVQEAARWNNAVNKNFRNLVLSITGKDIEEMMSKCYGQYGCFSAIGPWKNDLTRPVSLFPNTPESINPQYCLYTRRNPLECEPLLIDDKSSIYRSSYNPRGQVYFIIHGFVESGARPWIKTMTAELLKRSASNVVVVGWQGGASPPYSQAVANIRLVGVMTAHLINTMVHEVVGLKAEKIHIIGHSLGAHLASYIGTALRRTFNMKLGRITGLDPAEPHFAETDNIVRLDPSDAIFVDNIHTDAGGFTRLSLGMRAPVGHVDFYPNGGHNQPGCPKSIKGHMNRENGSFSSGVRSYLNCDHIKSYLYFIETINQDMPTTAVKCSSWDEYLNGTCFSCDAKPDELVQCAPMGFHSIQAFLPSNYRRKYGMGDPMLIEPPKMRSYNQMYLITDGNAPYYLNQYRVTVEVANTTRDSGLLEINVIGSKGESGFIPLDSLKYFDGGSIQTAVVAGPRVGALDSAILRWSHQPSLLNILSWRVNLPKFEVHMVTLETIDQHKRLHLCAPTELQSGYPVQLKHCTPER